MTQTPAAFPPDDLALSQPLSLAGPDRPRQPAADLPDRPSWRAMRCGFRRRCPQCGQGALFDGYLKVADQCPICHAALYHHRADDGPAYLTILVVGHVVVPLMHVTFTRLRPDPLVLATVFCVVAVALSLYLLPRLKGAVVGLQWARRMYGFGSMG